MKLTHPDLEYVPDTDGTGIPVLVIEDPKFFRSFLSDLFSQTDGLAGRAVLSINDAPVDMSKYLEILDRFVPFEINRKPLLTKILGKSDVIGHVLEYGDARIGEWLKRQQAVRVLR